MPESTPHKCVIAFDLDDTLYKERDYVRSGRRAVARFTAAATGLGADALMDIMDACGPTGPGAFDRLLAHIANTAPAAKHIGIDEILAVYRYHKPEISLTTEAEALLAKLKDAGHHLALITDGRSTTQRLKFEALGLGRFFAPEAVFISEETGGDKTSPAGFEAVERLFSGIPHRTYIGDNPAKDFRHPRRMGWNTVMLADSEAANVFRQDLDSVAPEFRPHTVVFKPEDAFSYLIQPSQPLKPYA